MFKFIQLSSLEKVFWDYKEPKKEFEKMSVLRNERFSYQIAYAYFPEGEYPNKRLVK